MQFPIVEPVRALSWKEPFATLMLHGKIETRTWPTHYRGLVLICASKVGYSSSAVYRICGKRVWDRLISNISFGIMDMKYGHGNAIAIGRLVDCRPMEPEDEDACFVQYHPDLYCHIYEDVQRIEAFPWKGKQGWSTLKDADRFRIRPLSDPAKKTWSTPELRIID
jgi:hypothetical protein